MIPYDFFRHPYCYFTLSTFNSVFISLFLITASLPIFLISPQFSFPHPLILFSCLKMHQMLIFRLLHVDSQVHVNHTLQFVSSLERM